MKKIVLSLLGFWLVMSCKQAPETPAQDPKQIALAANTAVAQSEGTTKTKDAIELNAEAWAEYVLPVKIAGRYQITVSGTAENGAALWIEDYVNNKDDRTYNITGNLQFSEGQAQVDGAPLDTGKHPIKIHAIGGKVVVKNISLSLMMPHTSTPKTLTQNMQGTDWELVWSDEFDGSGLPDSTKWSYNIGNWGWGNNEPQYYTAKRIENARLDSGNLIIEAHKNDMGQAWTSARLTTQGKVRFTYGKIEFRAKVPVGRGTWSAGWLLGDAYRDEISWPYCGEIDVLECVGYEINDTTGNGLNHASCHTRAYYFKQGNHLTATTPVENMNGEWHTYGIVWYPDSVTAYVDDTFYYTYDKTANELEWPFAKPQNIILNLAVGGGWGGAKGIDENWNNHQFILDYVRVYQRVEKQNE